eukprot:gene8967-12095_t
MNIPFVAKRSFHSSNMMLFENSCKLRFLESNSWEIQSGSIRFLIDPIMSQLDFGVPALYAGNKKFINGEVELVRLAQTIDFVLISQGFDDHAHKPTLSRLQRLKPTLSYICPPSAVSILKSCGIEDKFIKSILPGQKTNFEKGNESVEIFATTGALLGPPWQQKENGYVIEFRNGKKIYYEPHCMYDEKELLNIKVDVVITPVVSQELPNYTLVAGGLKALNLAKLLNAKYIIPMANGDLKATGLLANLINEVGSEEQFKQITQQKSKNIKVISAPAGKMVEI